MNFEPKWNEVEVFRAAVSKSMHGKYTHTVDPKGRIIIPSKIREALGTDFIMAPGLEDCCIYVFSPEEWDIYVEKLKLVGGSAGEIIDMVRIMQSSAADCTYDSQGRTVIPPELREAAQLGKEVAIVGVGSRAEIWKLDVWQAKEAHLNETRQKLRDKIYSDERVLLI